MPSRPLLRPLSLTVTAVTLVLAATGCTGGGAPVAAGSATPTPSATATAISTVLSAPAVRTSTPARTSPSADSVSPSSTALTAATATGRAAVVRPMRAPGRTTHEVSRVVYLPRRNEVFATVERDARRGTYEIRAACTAVRPGRQLSVVLYDARERPAGVTAISPTLATFDVACTGQVSTVGFAGFGVGGPVQISLPDTSGVTSAYAVLDPATG